MNAVFRNEAVGGYLKSQGFDGISPKDLRFRYQVGNIVMSLKSW